MDTIRRWIVTVLGAAGIDTNVFKAHSTRAAATSKAASKNVPIETILAAGMWNRENTFTNIFWISMTLILHLIALISRRLCYLRNKDSKKKGLEAVSAEL